MTQPYGDTAEQYWDAGWLGVIPLPAGQKKPAPTGYTGWNGEYPSWPDVMAWSDERPESNIALRLPADVLGLDVDNYAGKNGAASLAAAEQRWGKLPATWRSTSRTDGVSGIRLYRVPVGLSWPGELPGGGIETVHSGHRYVVAAPSVHPNGGVYGWWRRTYWRDAVPNVDDLPDLPAAWIEGLSRGAHVAEAMADVNTQTWLDGHAGGPCGAMSAALTTAGEDTRGSRHEHANRHTLIVARLAEEGHTGGGVAFGFLKRLFLERMATDNRATPREAEAEYQRAVSGAIARVEGSPTLGVNGDPCDHGKTFDVSSPQPNPENAATAATAPQNGNAGRHLQLTSLADIELKPVYWLWKNRLALGTLGLLAGREGLGKSTLAYWIAARITRGELYGQFGGTPKSVLICATEDSWEHTIGPRLIAAGADPARIYRVEVVTQEGAHVGLSLPKDNAALERDAVAVDAALLLLDPLMSRLDVGLDTHRDGEVRQALEPLVAIADKTNMSILGLIHHNKSGSSDPLQLVMGSKAFTAVARSVHTVIADPDDDQRRLFGTPKNNLGRDDLPTFAFAIEGHRLATPSGEAWTSRLVWGDESEVPIAETMRRAGVEEQGDKLATTEATGWLLDYLSNGGGQALSKEIKAAARSEGHSDASLRVARSKLKITTTAAPGVFPRSTFWSLPEANTPLQEVTA